MNRIFGKDLFLFVTCYGFLMVCHTEYDLQHGRNMNTFTTSESISTTFTEATIETSTSSGFTEQTSTTSTQLSIETTTETSTTTSSIECALDVPQNVTATQGSSPNTIVVSWTLAAVAIGYKIYRSGTYNGTYTEIGTSFRDSYTNTGLPVGTTYYYKVAATNADYESDLSASVIGMTYNNLPIPTNVTATDKDFEDKIVVSWTSVADATGYKIYRSGSDAGTYAEIGTSTTEIYENTGLTEGSTYYYKVTATAAPCVSDPSASTKGKTCRTLTAPTNVTASDRGYEDKVIVSWTSVTGATEYKIYRSDTNTGTYTEIGASTTETYENTGFAAGTTFYYKVATMNVACESKQSASVMGMICPLATPMDVTATQGSFANKIVVSWSLVADATGYKIYRSNTETGTYTEIGTGTVNTYEDTGLVAETTYYYKVAATSATCESGPSASASGMTRPYLTVPTDVAATQSSFANKIVVSWSLVADATEYKIYRSNTVTGTYTEIGTSTTETYENIGLTAATTYYYKVAATNATYESKLSASVLGMTHPPLSVPTNVVATQSFFTSKIVVSWTPVTYAAGYKIYRAGTETGIYAIIGTSTTETYENIGLTAATTYYYKVVATDTGYESAQSASTIGMTCHTLSTPTNVTTTQGSFSDKVVVSWTSVMGATGYKIYCSNTETGTYAEIGTSATETYTYKWLSNGTFYYYKVAAMDATCESDQSTSALGWTCSLGKPTDVMTTQGTFSNKIVITWTPVDYATGYKIYRFETDADTYPEIGTSATNTYEDIGLAVATAFYYKVVATVDTCESYPSDYAQGFTWQSAIINLYRDNLTGWDFVPDSGQTAIYRTGDDGDLAPLHAMNFTDHGNGTVTDNLTHLMWEKSPSNISYTWPSAFILCEWRTTSGYTDWRLPTLIELTSIVDYSQSYPSINPMFTCQSSYYWSATTNADNTAYAWYVDFNNGLVDNVGKASSYYVLCVR